MYIILRDRSQDLGEGYSSSWANEFLGVVKDFNTARNIIEYFADHEIGEETNYDYCYDECKKGFCGGCIYNEHGTVDDDDWNRIVIFCDDIYDTVLEYHFIRVEL